MRSSTGASSCACRFGRYSGWTAWFIGGKHPGVPLEQSQRLHNKLKAAGVSSTLHIVKGASHGGKAFQTQQVRQVILTFFNKHLRTTQ